MSTFSALDQLKTLREEKLDAARRLAAILNDNNGFGRLETIEHDKLVHEYIVLTDLIKGLARYEGLIGRTVVDVVVDNGLSCLKLDNGKLFPIYIQEEPDESL
jgi:hypothetical protein